MKRCWVLGSGFWEEHAYTPHPEPNTQHLAFIPSVPADERDEGAGAVLFVLEALLSPDHADEALRLARLADGEDEAPADLELCEQRLGHARAARRDEDAVVGRVRAPTHRAVEALDGGVVDAQGADARLRLARQLRDALDGVDLPGDAR